VSETPLLHREAQQHAFDPAIAPVLTVEDGATVHFQTADARQGALDDMPDGLWPLPPPPARGNPVCGPLAIRGARPGDALLVNILHVEPAEFGWIGGHANANGLPPGRIPQALGRRLPVRNGHVEWGGVTRLRTRPMLGCIGAAPKAAVSTAMAGRHGGNLDHPLVTVGATVWLPVAATGGLLSLGDVHAAQGDGELAGTAVEVAADVLVRVTIRPAVLLAWPWVMTDDRLAVMTTGRDFAEARSAAVDAAVDLLERSLSMAPADALALLSAAGDLRLGQAFGARPPTLRLELPRTGVLASIEPGAPTGPAPQSSRGR
jgi:amidase